MPKDVKAHVDDLIAKIWKVKQAPILDEALLATYVKSLTDASMKAAGFDLDLVDWRTKESKTVYNLLNNVWQFSAAKTYTELKDIGALLVNPDGSWRSEKDFIIEAQRLAKTQLNWLKTERNTAIGGSQMIALWQKIQDQKDIFPFIQFDAVMDQNTTALCASLDGVIKHVDDPFVSIYFPLNHFGCRLTVRQLRRGEVTPEDKTPYPEIPKMFRTNLGERGIVFPPDHAYFVGIPDEVYTLARRQAPYEVQFDILDESDALKGIVRRHYQVNTSATDYGRVMETALHKARENAIVDILPVINPVLDLADQRSIIFKDAKTGKSPDMRINGVLVEEEASTRSWNLNNIKHAIDAGAKQANYVIVSLSEEVSFETMNRVAIGRFKDHAKLEIIEFRFNGVYTEFKRR